MALFIFGHASARFFGTLRMTKYGRLIKSSRRLPLPRKTSRDAFRKTKYGRTYKKQATLAGSSREHDPYDFLPPPATHDTLTTIH